MDYIPEWFSKLSICTQRPIYDTDDVNTDDMNANVNDVKRNDLDADIMNVDNMSADEHFKLWYEKEAEKRYKDVFITSIFGIGEMFPSDIPSFGDRLIYAEKMKKRIDFDMFERLHVGWNIVKGADGYTTEAASIKVKYNGLCAIRNKLSANMISAIEPLKQKGINNFEMAKSLVKLMNLEERKRFSQLQERNINAKTFDELITRKEYEDKKKIENQKENLLREFKKLERQGFQLSKQYNMQDSLEKMESEYNKVMAEISPPEEYTAEEKETREKEQKAEIKRQKRAAMEYLKMQQQQIS